MKYLSEHSCQLLREGAKHSLWGNNLNYKRSAVPRHTEISDHLAVKICKDLGIEKIK